MRYIRIQRYFTLQRAENLLPYIDRFEESDLSDFAEVLESLEVPEWNKEYLAKYFNEKDRRRFIPFDEDLIQEVKKYAIIIMDCGTFKTYGWKSLMNAMIIKIGFLMY